MIAFTSTTRFAASGLIAASLTTFGLAQPTYYEPTAENAASGDYPLARFLYIAINKHPNRELSPRDREFLKMVLSKEGQEVVVRDGYIPLLASVAKEWRVKLGMEPAEEKKEPIILLLDALNWLEHAFIWQERVFI